MADFNLLLLYFSTIQFLVTGTILLFSSRGINKTNKYFALFLISKAVCYTGIILPKFGFDINFTIYFSIALSVFDLLLGPFLYFYISGSTTNSLKINFLFFLHFLPFFIIFIITSFYYFFNIQIIINQVITQGIYSLLYFRIHDVIIYTHFIIYSSFAVSLLTKYKKHLIENFSDSNLSKFKWLQIVLAGFISIWLLNIIQIVLNINGLMMHWIFSLTLFFIFLFSNITLFTAIRHPEIFRNKVSQSRKKYENILLSEDELNTYKQKINQLINEKVYLDNLLSLNDLASKLKTNTHTASLIINQEYKKNFNDFINFHRVNEFCRLIESDSSQSKTLLEIAYECGFNSKSVFNETFKKFKKTTPSSYRKSLTPQSNNYKITRN